MWTAEVSVAEILLSADDRPGTHALVIGISRYPYLDGAQQTDEGREYGLTNLTTAARSAAEVAGWLLQEHRNLDAPLASLSVLLSPVDGEVIPPALAAKLHPPLAATSSAVRKAFGKLRKRCEARPGNVAFVYVAGHGVQLTKRGAVVLLEDFASPRHLNAFDGAIDMVGLHAAFNGSGYAAKQAWFVDACRQRGEVADRFEQLVGAFKLDEPRGQVESSPLYLASSSREAAFAIPGETTLFSTALLEALRGGAATGPARAGDEWQVSVYSLAEMLTKTVDLLAAEDGEVQRVDITGRVTNATLHRFHRPPDVDLRIEISPLAAARSCKASLYFGGKEEVVSAAAEWPLERRVKAGLYTLTVDADPPYRAIAGLPGDVRPLKHTWPVEVS